MTKYFVAVKASNKDGTFEFDTEKDQLAFIDDMNKMGVEWMKSKIEE